VCSVCEFCGESLSRSVLIRTCFIRVCIYCGKENPWPLAKDQKPVGYSIDKEKDNSNDR